MRIGGFGIGRGRFGRYFGRGHGGEEEGCLTWRGDGILLQARCGERPVEVSGVGQSFEFRYVGLGLYFAWLL